jgi:hypothetical protein
VRRYNSIYTLTNDETTPHRENATTSHMLNGNDCESLALESECKTTCTEQLHKGGHDRMNHSSKTCKFPGAAANFEGASDTLRFAGVSTCFTSICANTAGQNSCRDFAISKWHYPPVHAIARIVKYLGLRVDFPVHPSYLNQTQTAGQG